MSSTPIIFNITDAGRLASVDQQNNGLNLRLKKIAFGTGHYDSTNHKTRTHLDQPIEEAFIAAGGTPPGTSNLILGVNFVPTHKVEASEVGIFTENGVLFAVASVPAGEFFTLNPQVAFVGSFGLAVGTTPNVTVEIQVDAPIVQQLMFNHETALNPHPQYVKNTDYNAHVAQNNLEHSNLITLINAVAQHANMSLDEAVNYLASLISDHKNALNPHPQYLLASTFGVDLLMSANVNTPLEDKNRVFGWNGENGDTTMFHKSIRWWNWHDETVTFKPYRAYGYFLLAIFCKPEGDAYLELRIFDKNDVMIAENLIWERHDTSFHDYVKNVFYLRKGDYVQVRIHGRPWNQNWAEFSGSIYVNDRVKTFNPVGYQSSVLLADSSQNGSESTVTPIDYSVYPASEWSYFDSDTNLYVALPASSFISPANHNPHYHRVLLSLFEADLWISIEVGKQSIQTPSDYAMVDAKVVRGSTDSTGNLVVIIPLSMRSIAVTDGVQVVYKVAYYDHEIVGFPSGSLDGEHVFYVDP